MDLRQLTHFVAVAEDGSFTLAARRMNIVQSGISSSIAALERDLGVSLFRRSNHRVQLTAAGQALIVEARRALAAVATGRAAAIAARSQLAGRLRIGVARTIPRSIEFPRVVKHFHHANPDVALQLTEIGASWIEELRAGDLDVVVGPYRDLDGLGSIALGRSPIVLACAESHPLSERLSVSMAALAGEQLIDLPERWVARTLADRALADAAITRGTVIEVASIQIALQLVAENIGVALLPDVAAEGSRGVAFIPFKPSIGSWECAVTFLGDVPATPAADAFVNLLTIGSSSRRSGRSLRAERMAGD